MTRKIGRPSRQPLRGVSERNALVEANLSLVHWFLTRFASAIRDPHKREDLFQAGCQGLMRAAELWDPEQGTFSTYAVRWIRQAVGREGARMMGLIQLPNNLSRLTREQLEEMRRKVDTVSLSGGLEDWWPGGPVDRRPGCESEVIGQDGEERIWSILRARLTPNAFEAVRLVAGQGLTRTEAGVILGLSKERIRQLIEKAKRVLREEGFDGGESGEEG